jgi:hypothetical protein
MDYKYIEQLLERYWQCETTLQEENILRSFFSQEEVPASLAPYKALFVSGEPERTLGREFDEHILTMIAEAEPVKARTISLTQRLMPLFKAAAVVAIVLTLVNAAQAPWEWGYSDPKTALQAQDKDSIDMQEPVQAENIMDTSAVVAPIAPVLPKY